MASRSAETSPVTSAPRCTPPMPPVENTPMPAACGQGQRGGHGRGAVLPARRHRHAQIPLGRLAGRTADPVVLARDGHPPGAHRRATAVTAGTAPPARTAARHRSRASRLAGPGSPRCEKMVDSSATTAPPAARASATSASTTGRDAARRPSCQAAGRSGDGAGEQRRLLGCGDAPRGLVREHQSRQVALDGERFDVRAGGPSTPSEITSSSMTPQSWYVRSGPRSGRLRSEMTPKPPGCTTATARCERSPRC